MPDTKLYIRNKGPLKGYYIKAYKLKDPSPTSYKKGIRNTGTTIIINKELILYKKSSAKAVKNKRLLTQVEINYIYCKIGRQ